MNGVDGSIIVCHICNFNCHRRFSIVCSFSFQPVLVYNYSMLKFLNNPCDEKTTRIILTLTLDVLHFCYFTLPPMYLGPDFHSFHRDAHSHIMDSFREYRF